MAGPVSLTLSTDVVPFAIRAERLEVLVVRQPGGWRLPGGSLGVGEHLDTAARRQLIEQTGLDEVYLEQLYTFGRPARGVGTLAVAVAYYALVPTGALAADSVASGAATAWILSLIHI